MVFTHKRATAGAIALVATVGLGFAIASPAAAEIGPNDSIYIADWAGQLLTVDATTGVSTPKGASLEPDPEKTFGATGIEIDGATGEGIAISYKDNSGLYRISAAGGPATLIGNIRTTDDEPVGYCTGLDVSSAGILTTCDNVGTENNVVGSLDPITAQFTKLLPGGQRYAALATDPTTGIHYGFGYNGRVYSLDLQAGTVAEVGSFGSQGFSIYGADFDSDGVLWAAGYSYGPPDDNPDVLPDIAGRDDAGTDDSAPADDNAPTEGSVTDDVVASARAADAGIADAGIAAAAANGPALLRFNTADWTGVAVGLFDTAGGEPIDSPEALTVVNGVAPATVVPSPTTAAATLANTGTDALPIALGGFAALLVGLAVALPLLRRARA